MTRVEFVLNAIVERKEVRDLSGSIIDRRCVGCVDHLLFSSVGKKLILRSGLVGVMQIHGAEGPPSSEWTDAHHLLG